MHILTEHKLEIFHKESMQNNSFLLITKICGYLIELAVSVLKCLVFKCLLH